MNILAIDTITPILSVSASGPSGISTLEIDSGSQHAEKIVDALAQVSAISGFEPRETSAVCVPAGPGSFTGLRLAWAAARGLQLAARCSVYPIPSLECYAARFADWPGVVLSSIDAKKNRFYIQAFRRGTAVTEALDQDAQKASSLVDPAERILVTGPDAVLFGTVLRDVLPVSDITIIPSGQNGASKEFIEFANSNRVRYTHTIPDHEGPVYVRKSDAEENYTSK